MNIKNWSDGVYLIFVWLIVSILLILDLSILNDYTQLLNSIWIISICSFMLPIDKSFLISKLLNKIYK